MTPELQLKTLFSLRPALPGAGHRILATLEAHARPGPSYVLIRGSSTVTWAVRADVPAETADQLDRFAREEPPISDFEAPPLHADAYQSLVGGRPSSGPAFTFPEKIAQTNDVSIVDRIDLLERNFRGWRAEEIQLCAPICAVMDSGYPVSVCFCATRNSAPAVEAGVETAVAFRGRGFAARVTAAWACAVRASGRIPLYSTNWTNAGSRGVARKLGLIQYATNWSL